MAVTVIATSGASNANSYCTSAEADTYHEGHPYASDWTGATADTKNRALVTATRLLDEHIEWDGNVVNNTQALLWPRNGMFYLNGYYVANTIIPQKLKDATAEFARQIVVADRMKDMKQEAEGVERLEAGSVAMTFKNSTPKVIPDAVWFMVQQWGQVRSRKSGVVRLVRA